MWVNDKFIIYRIQLNTACLIKKGNSLMKQKYLAIALSIFLIASNIWAETNPGTGQPAASAAQPQSDLPQMSTPPSIPNSNVPNNMQSLGQQPGSTMPASPQNNLQDSQNNAAQTAPPARRRLPQAPPAGGPSSNLRGDGIEGTSAGGESQMTVIDENGNLKLIEKPKSPSENPTPSVEPKATSPGMNQAGPRDQVPAPGAPLQPKAPSFTPPANNNTSPQSMSPPNPLPANPAQPSVPSGAQPPAPLENSPLDNSLNKINQAM